MREREGGANLDELPEFGQHLIEVLRQPMEGQPREVAISRAAGTLTYPANFMLIAAQNPCWSHAPSPT